jgi:hypothetical protein
MAATAMAAGANNNQLKTAAEKMVVMVAAATAIAAGTNNNQLKAVVETTEVVTAAKDNGGGDGNDNGNSCKDNDDSDDDGSSRSSGGGSSVDEGGNGCSGALGKLLLVNNATIMSMMFPTRPTMLMPPQWLCRDKRRRHVRRGRGWAMTEHHLPSSSVAAYSGS